MSDWFKKISSLISSPQDSVSTTTPLDNGCSALFSKLEKLPDTGFESQTPTRRDPTFYAREQKHHKSPALPKATKEETAMSNTTQDDDNIKALKKLRSLPRGTQVDSRIAAIRELLGEHEIFKTLMMLRWPQGVVCPRCHSSNVVRRDPPADAVDQRHFYVCLNCKGEGNPSDFDDFTGLPIGEMHALRQWILCWYLIGFCSVAQIAKVLGISIQEVMQIAQLGNEITMLPEDQHALQAKQELKERKLQEDKKQRLKIDEQEDYTRSASKAPLKPGYKSKK
ncbi:MAG: transposase [Proteobacteria bacterium]|nr:transposase [Pseudomonadota bacterium]